MTLNSVVLPAPLGPITPTTSPGATVSETSSRAIRPPKRTVTPATSSAITLGWCARAAHSSWSCAKVEARAVVRGAQGEEDEMSSGTLERVADVRAERERILLAVHERLEEVVDAAVAAMRVEIPAYDAAPDGLLDDVRHQVRRHYETKLGCLLAEEEVKLEHLAFARGAAMRRARAGLALEDYINAFRVGQQVFWEAVLECAGEDMLGREAALTL